MSVESVQTYRNIWLQALRSGEWYKANVILDDMGSPVSEVFFISDKEIARRKRNRGITDLIRNRKAFSWDSAAELWDRRYGHKGGGSCACGVANTIIGDDWLEKVDITAEDCSAIIKLNDKPHITFDDIADQLELYNFHLPDSAGCEIHDLHDSACPDCRVLNGQYYG